MDIINERIIHEVCHNTIEELTDEKLMYKYKEAKSVKNEIKILENILGCYVDENIKNNIINDYLIKLVPAGTKGNIRGLKFNDIVKNIILEINLDSSQFEIMFEKKCGKYKISEIPDWYILEHKTEKIIIGMNQVDLWSGGHQRNRGDKYINDSNNNDKKKLLCVICNLIQFKNKKNKTYNLFEAGFRNNTLCYIKNLKNIILSYFNL